ncbi:6-hydroxy-D-nicotine oxidase [Nannizzia gypsea CBS 118893]|uniref:6-hydroxy-D-nicotine oxidase n=1 Tax=Arthroderma gypseum (strain ATCC MYA-4604 / CBS 118893) TaxID=535722 RepID=E4V6Q2_ARTGP|nr:6-hydroxy-D-nicotine oxidase [Nannizzia gypsea CBS 118893]EFQ96768.1 6-hydroxy-D-nicotine oxidase [Nannizzia gypsea CBS 118893]
MLDSAPFSSTAEHRQEPTPFDPAVDAQGSEPIIQTLTTLDSALKLYTRSSPHYESLRGCFNKLITARPLVICRPVTIEQVQLIVRAVSDLPAGNECPPLAVRGGGHDVWGRGCIADSVTIDVRELDQARLAEDKQSVTAGGGILSGNLVGFLNNHGLCTSNGTAADVGWTGWAVWGGYGPFNDYLGLGVDNILAAKVVLADGRLVEAKPESELLWAIRGAGGNFGVIVEVTVKVYHMPTILGGFIVYKWEETEQALHRTQELLDKGVPDALGIQVGFNRSRVGLGMSLIYTWADSNDLDEGKKWLETLKQLATVVVDTTTETTFKDFQAMTTKPFKDPIDVCTRSISIPRFTPETIAILLKYAEDIPIGGRYNVVSHVGHGKGTKPNNSTCFGTREPHILFHINAPVPDGAGGMERAQAWVDGLMADIKGTGQALKPVYVSFMGKDEETQNSFGQNWKRLQELKGTLDKRDLFRFAQPMLGKM